MAADNKEKWYWEGKHFAFFQNDKCEYFPCHETTDTENFNCLFCYCPLYALGENCGGNFAFTAGVKECSGCLVPHKRKNYGYIVGKYSEIMELVKQGLSDEVKKRAGETTE
ncbi:cysteine-rich small domain-containing protein [Oscillospiraceae bacterium OttesenSCG-928-G22]|nr:cysteine-rich small domain-containing protein [Oscillospiraceae bacterium OttesenSCG-928-G22]